MQESHQIASRQWQESTNNVAIWSINVIDWTIMREMRANMLRLHIFGPGGLRAPCVAWPLLLPSFSLSSFLGAKTPLQVTTDRQIQWYKKFQMKKTLAKTCFNNSNVLVLNLEVHNFFTYGKNLGECLKNVIYGMKIYGQLKNSIYGIKLLE